MAHAFPPPFRWEYLSRAEIATSVLSVCLPVAVVVALISTRRAYPSPRHVKFWLAVSALVPWASPFLAVPFTDNWKHRMVGVPLLLLSFGVVALLSAFGAIRTSRRLPSYYPRYPTYFWCVLYLFVYAAVVPVACVQVAGEGGRAIDGRGKLSQLGLALHRYHESTGSFPPAQIGQPFHSWRVALLGFGEADHRFASAKYDSSQSWDSNGNTRLAKVNSRSHRCPTRPQIADSSGRYFTDFAMVTGDGTFSPRGRRVRKSDVTDGEAFTIALTEASGLNIVWTEPRDADLDRYAIGVNLPGDGINASSGIASSWHPRGANSLFVDGSVRFLSEDIDHNVLKALTTIDGGEPVGDF